MSAGEAVPGAVRLVSGDPVAHTAEERVSRAELDAHTTELERVRTRLAETVRGAEQQQLGDAA